GKVYVCGNTNGNLYLQSSATDSVEAKLSSNLLAAEQFVAQYDKAGALTSMVKATGGLAGGTMEYLAQSNNKLIGVGVYSASIAFGSHNMPATGGNVGAYFIGFYQIGTGSTGLNNVSNQFVSNIYPNPSNGLVNIETDLGNTINEVVVTDVTGKLYQVSVSLKANQAVVDLAELNTGLYFATIKSKAGNSTQKIIKQ
ncbi:MAG: T9SS type A sorting domain-containing protein, partial [Bacteroidia bacterium]|nr:T9SS type A sorting domain-containing protein [Bacteroidia bacterium]